MGKPGRPGATARWHAAWRKAPWQPRLPVGKVGPRATQRHRTPQQRHEFRHQRTSSYQQRTSPHQRLSPHRQRSPRISARPGSGTSSTRGAAPPDGPHPDVRRRPPSPIHRGSPLPPPPSQLHRSDSECS